MPIPLAGQIAISAAPAIVGAFGAERSNRVNQAEARKNREFQARQAQRQMDFQERMRNTSWQASVADMHAAGLNPALAYSQGPAAAPGGAAGGGSQAAPAADVVSSALQGKLMAASLKKAQAEARSAEANARVDDATSNILFPRDGGGLTRSLLRRRLEGEVDLLNENIFNVRQSGRANAARADANWQAELMRFLRNPGGAARNFFRWNN